MGAFFLQKNINTRYIVMIILTTSPNQTFAIIPKRFFDSTAEDAYLLVENETTKDIFLYSLFTKVSIVKDIAYVNLNLTNVLLQENTFYIFTIALGEELDEIVYKDRVFVTNQSQSTYSINNSQYTSTSIDNNSYITI